MLVIDELRNARGRDAAGAALRSAQQEPAAHAAGKRRGDRTVPRTGHACCAAATSSKATTDASSRSMAAPEPLLEVCERIRSCVLARIAYHLGNRHVAVQVGEGWLRLQPPTRCSATCCSASASSVREVTAPFEPEAGAYSHGHQHDTMTAAQDPSVRGEPDEHGRPGAPAAAGQPGAAGRRLQLFAGTGMGGRKARIVTDEASAGAWIEDVLRRSRVAAFEGTAAGAHAGGVRTTRDGASMRRLNARIPRQPRNRGIARRDGADGTFAGAPAARPRRVHRRSIGAAGAARSTGISNGLELCRLRLERRPGRCADRLSLVVAGESGDGRGQAGAARPDRRSAHAVATRRAHCRLPPPAP